MAFIPENRSPLGALLAQISGASNRIRPSRPIDGAANQEREARPDVKRRQPGQASSGRFSSLADIEQAKARIRAMAQNNLFTLDAIGLNRARVGAVLQPMGQIIDIRV